MIIILFSRWRMSELINCMEVWIMVWGGDFGMEPNESESVRCDDVTRDDGGSLLLHSLSWVRHRRTVTPDSGRPSQDYTLSRPHITTTISSSLFTRESCLHLEERICSCTGRRLHHRVPEYSRPCFHSSKPCVMWLKCCLCEHHQHWQLSPGQLSDAAIITKLFTAVGSMQTTHEWKRIKKQPSRYTELSEREHLW